MRKEITLAIVFGSILGLLIVGGIWWSNKTGPETAPKSQDLVQQQDSTPSASENGSLSGADQANAESTIFIDIDFPDEGAIVDQDEVKVSGQTSPEAVVVLIYPEGETIVTADDQGSFEATALLVGGANEIKVTAYDRQGNRAEALLTVVYSTAKL
jgi:hypothetical protein